MEGATEDKQSSTSSTCRSGNSAMDPQETGLKERNASTNLGLFVSYIDQNQLEGSIESIYGSAAKDIEAIFELKKQRLSLHTTGSSLLYQSVATKRRQSTRTCGAQVARKDVIVLDDESDEKESPTALHQPFVIDYHSGENDSPAVKPQPSIVNIDSDDEFHDSARARPPSVHVKLEPMERSASQTEDIAEVEDQGMYNGSPSEDNGLTEKGGDQQPSNPYPKPSYPFQDIFLALPANGFISSAEKGKTISESKDRRLGEQNVAGKMGNGKGVYVGVDNDVEEHNKKGKEDDGLGDIWKEMNIALESNKDYGENHSSNEERELECNHSTVLKEDIGYVCRICGLIQQSIESIFEFQYGTKRTTRTYRYESRSSRIGEPAKLKGLKLSEDGFIATDFSAHPRHKKQMKPHQVEGFNFLISNLVTENPGGCILAHAPGSGKTFLVISFIQSFLAKYPNARPMVVLPKGILATWKKEFKIWQVEDVPLYDFYSAKAESKAQQLEVLEKWVADKSILFLGYTQFSKLVCGQTDDTTIAACRQILLKVPSILILDEGHTPRNDNTDVFDSLAQVRTQRKVVLSGTLYQNHVKEVFNIVNLVRPNFLRLDTSREIVRRIESKVRISGVGKNVKGNRGSGFYELVENTLQDSENLNGKMTVIQDLREMTCNILHYYKGDFLEELPGFDDFTVLLNLNPEQQKEVKRIRKLSNFKRIAVGSAIYIHPQLKQLSEKGGDKLPSDDLIDEMIRGMDIREAGAKAKFFLNMLRLCESTGEKLLVFSQYLLPLKFLERLAVKERGWSPGKETFMISGDSSAEMREWSMERFNTSSSAKIFFGSIKACGEGISLVGASRIIILDIHLNPSVSRQAIGRAYRPGQKKKVYTYRLVAADSPEEEDHQTCFRKELISKMWFEWDKYSITQDFMMKNVDRDQCGDEFLESPLFLDDVKALFRR